MMMRRKRRNRTKRRTLMTKKMLQKIPTTATEGVLRLVDWVSILLVRSGPEGLFEFYW
jgi:hypothetical protein